jgi:hypothetical protein
MGRPFGLAYEVRKETCLFSPPPSKAQNPPRIEGTIVSALQLRNFPSRPIRLTMPSSAAFSGPARRRRRFEAKCRPLAACVSRLVAACLSRLARSRGSTGPRGAARISFLGEQYLSTSDEMREHLGHQWMLNPLRFLPTTSNARKQCPFPLGAMRKRLGGHIKKQGDTRRPAPRVLQPPRQPSRLGIGLQYLGAAARCPRILVSPRAVCGAQGRRHHDNRATRSTAC